MSVAMALAEARHHTAPRGQTTAEVHVRRSSEPEEQCGRDTEFHSLFKDEHGGRRPDSLAGVRPQNRVSRHTLEHAVDVWCSGPTLSRTSRGEGSVPSAAALTAAWRSWGERHGVWLTLPVTLRWEWYWRVRALSGPPSYPVAAEQCPGRGSNRSGTVVDVLVPCGDVQEDVSRNASASTVVVTCTASASWLPEEW